MSKGQDKVIQVVLLVVFFYFINFYNILLTRFKNYFVLQYVILQLTVKLSVKDYTISR